MQTTTTEFNAVADVAALNDIDLLAILDQQAKKIAAHLMEASDADIEPALKRSETLASLDRLEADGAWVMR